MRNTNLVVGMAAAAVMASAAAGQLSFTTEPLAMEGEFNNLSSVGVDSAGVVHVAYKKQHHTDSATAEVWYANNAGGTWHHLQLTSNSVRDESPSLVIDRNDKVHIAIHTGTQSANKIRYVSNVNAPFGGMDAGFIDLATGPSASIGFIFPKIGVDSLGNVHAVFMNQGAANSDVYYARLAPDGAITGPTNLTTSSQSEQEAYLAVGPDDVVHITYRNPLSGNTQVGYMNNRSGSFVVVPTFITPFTGSSPVPLVTPTGALSVAYRQSDILHLVNANPDGTWADPPSVIDLSPANRPAIYERFAVGADGRRYFAYSANIGDRGTWVVAENAGGFDAPVSLYSGSSTNNGTSIAINASGKIAVSWAVSYFDTVSISDLFVSTAQVAGVCIADFDHSGSVSVQDIFDFLAAYFSNDPGADVNGADGVTVQDIFDFLAAYFSGCR